MKEWFLVISMWGNTGEEWLYIGNQVVLDQAMTQPQCEYMVKAERWTPFYDNEYYKMVIQCYPKECQGKESCD